MVNCDFLDEAQNGGISVLTPVVPPPFLSALLKSDNANHIGRAEAEFVMEEGCENPSNRSWASSKGTSRPKQTFGAHSPA